MLEEDAEVEVIDEDSCVPAASLRLQYLEIHVPFFSEGEVDRISDEAASPDCEAALLRSASDITSIEAVKGSFSAEGSSVSAPEEATATARAGEEGDDFHLEYACVQELHISDICSAIFLWNWNPA